MVWLRSVITTALLSVWCASCAPVVANEYDGPYGAYAPGPIKKLPNGGRPLSKTAFPPISDWTTLQISLSRSSCEGRCPIYTVEIFGDGTIHYKGDDYVAVVGNHRSRISADAVRTLYNAFQKAEFFWTSETYRAEITDQPTYTVKISFDGNAKTVVDYAGRTIGMPKEISDLEGAIDRTAETKRWVKGDETTFASLEAEHWDFRAADDEHQGLIASAANKGDFELVQKLLVAGVSAKNRFGCSGLEDAAFQGRLEIVTALAAAGAPIHWDMPKGKEYMTCDALRAAATSGVPSVVRVILDLHPSINWQDSNGRTALMAAASGAVGDSAQGRDFAAVVQMLIDTGADVNLKDTSGESAIMMVSQSGAVVRALLKAGAKDINTRNSVGETVLMTSYDPDVIQALLDGGADPWMVDNDGKNAYQNVRHTYGGPSNPGAKVLKRWMETHPNP